MVSGPNMQLTVVTWLGYSYIIVISTGRIKHGTLMPSMIHCSSQVDTWNLLISVGATDGPRKEHSEAI